MARRSKIQLELAFPGEAKGEAPSALGGGTEAIAAVFEDQSPAAFAQPSMEAIVERDNLRKALAQVKRNKGAAGIDGMSAEALSAHLKDALADDPRPIARGLLRAAAGEARRDTEGVWGRSRARRADTVGIMHLMQLALGMPDADGLSWRPMCGGGCPVRHRS